VTVREYIEATRRVLPSRKLSQQLVELFSSFGPTLNIAVPVVMTRTSTAECGFLQLGDEHYLIYDQHLTELLGLLNDCYFRLRGPGANMVAYRLFAESLYVYDEQRLALQFASSYQSMARRYAQSTGNIDERYLLIQTSLVVVHEIVHYLLRTEGSEGVVRRLPPSDAKRASRAAELYLTEAFEKQVRPVMHDYGSLTNVLDGLLGYIEDDPSPAWGEEGSEVVNSLGSLRIGEECFCDVVAFVATRMLLAKYGWAPHQLFEPCFLALHYLRLLAEVRGHVAKGLSMEHDARSYSWFASNARIWNMRRAGELVFDTGYEGDVLAALIDASTDYEIRIGIPVMERLYLLQNLSVDEHLDASEDGAALRSRVEDLLGFV
jgi:hypothetical protein